MMGAVYGECLIPNVKLGGAFFVAYMHCTHTDNEWMDGWMDGWMSGWMDGWMDGMDGWMDGWDGMDRWVGGLILMWIEQKLMYKRVHNE
jgi:hypothetical protein